MAFFGSKEYEKVKKKYFPEETVLYACKGDLTPHGEFAEYYLLLTKKKLILAQGETRVPQKVYGGYIGKYKPATEIGSLSSVTEVALQDAEKIWVHSLLSGGMLCVKTSAGEQSLFCFTSGLLGEVNRMVSLVGKVKKGEELTQEDTKDKV